MAESSKPTITEFLLARIAEDEDSVQRAWNQGDFTTRAEHLWACEALAGGTCDCASARRVLAECKAKRAIVEQAERTDSGWWESNYIAILAAVYADHPDYDPGWAA